jgi:hypothetical protein
VSGRFGDKGGAQTYGPPMVRPVHQRLAVVGIAVAVAGGGLVVASVAFLDRPSTAAPTLGHVQPLTPRQVHQAVRAAHWALAYFKAEPTTGATAISTTTAVDAGTVQPNIENCPSSGVVEVSVYGSFPHIVTGGRVYPPGETPGPLDGTVTSVLVDLDPATGQRCAHAVVTGQPSTVPGSRLLFGRAP